MATNNMAAFRLPERKKMKDWKEVEKEIIACGCSVRNEEDGSHNITGKETSLVLAKNILDSHGFICDNMGISHLPEEYGYIMAVSDGYMVMPPEESKEETLSILTEIENLIAERLIAAIELD